MSARLLKQLILHVGLYYFILQYRAMSRSVIRGWFEFVQPTIKHRKYLLVISISAKMQINKK